MGIEETVEITKPEFNIGDKVYVLGSNAVIVGILFSFEDGILTYTVRFDYDGRYRKCFANQMGAREDEFTLSACGRYKMGYSKVVEKDKEE
jgi:hypothetical protein